MIHKEGGEEEDLQIVEAEPVEDAGADNEPRGSQQIVDASPRVSMKNFGQERLSAKPSANQGLKQIEKQKFKHVYGAFREDQEEPEAGFSKELISERTKQILDETDVDTLLVWPF